MDLYYRTEPIDEQEVRSSVGVEQTESGLMSIAVNGISQEPHRWQSCGDWNHLQIIVQSYNVMQYSFNKR